MCVPRWTNWAGTVACTPAHFAKPATLQAIQDVVRSSAHAGRQVRVVGSGHSYSPLVATSGTLMSLDRYQGLESFDVQAGEATILGGTKLRRIGPLLKQADLAMINLGDTDAQSIAGAISTSTHGSGLQLGSLSQMVVGLTLVAGDGEVIECSRDRHPELFRAAAVSLGSLGIIAKVRLKVIPAYRVRRIKDNRPLEEVLSEIDGLTRDNRHFEFWAFPHADTVSTRTSNPTTDDADVSRLERFWENIVVDTAGLWLLSQAGRLRPLTRTVSRISAKLNSETASVDDSFRMLATPRHVKLREMEYAVPAAAGPACLREIMALIESSNFQVTFPIQYRYVAADDLFLSPFFEQPSALIDVQQFYKLDHEPYFRACEAIFRRYAGRPHWGKIHYQSAQDLRPLYPRWSDFQRLRRELDPGGLFLSPYLQHLFD